MQTICSIFQTLQELIHPGRVRGEGTLLYNHSVQHGALHIGETSINPITRDLYFICSQDYGKMINKSLIEMITNSTNVHSEDRDLTAK